MKKIIAITLVLIMLLSVVSCRQTGNDGTTTTTTTTTTTNNNEGNETPDDENNEGNEGDAVADLSSALADTFAATLQANPEATVEEVMNAICADPAIPYSPVMPNPIEDGTEFFFGFGNYTITGFESGMFCMPMIGSIAFIAYVFELPADADAEAFAEQLKSNFDYRWVICDVAADPVVKVVDNMVFFSSCPAPDAE